MCEILEFIDFEQLKQLPPKWFMGYSDNTNLIFLLATLTDTAAIYGPNAGAFGMEPWHASIQDAYELLQGKKLAMKNYPMWEKESLKDEEHPLAPIMSQSLLFCIPIRKKANLSRLRDDCLGDA